jgi:hypothetical protein
MSIVVEAKYTEVIPFHNGLARLCNEENVDRVINEKLEHVCDLPRPYYVYISDFTKNQVAVKLERSFIPVCSIINLSGKVLSKGIYLNIEFLATVAENDYYKAQNRDYKWGILKIENGKSCSTHLPFEYISIEGSNTLTVSRSESAYFFIDLLSGKMVFDQKFNNAAVFDEGFCWVKTNRRFNGGGEIINLKGEVVYTHNANSQIIEVGKFQSGLASAKRLHSLNPVKKNGRKPEFSYRYGYIDTDGRWVIPAIFDSAFGFSQEGLAAVCIEDMWGFITTNGQYRIEPKYRMILQDFSNGFAKVELKEYESDVCNDTWIDENGAEYFQD